MISRPIRAAGAALALTCAAGAAAACTTTVDDAASVEQPATATDDEKLVARGVDEPIAVPAPGKIVYEVVQPETLLRLEKDGWSVARHFGASGRRSNAELYASSRFYKGVADALTKDVQELRDADPRLTTRVVDYQNRVFDTGWLRSPYATYDLVAVLNRIDRKDFHAEGTSCGETRFVYRLSYVKDVGGVTNFSRMPMFFNVVYALPGGDCAAHVRRWHVASRMSTDDYVRWLEGSALDPTKLTLEQIEVNAQVVRMPSENKDDMGGHAEYFLRVYRQTGNVTELLSLENTPDVAKLRGDAALERELVAWVREHVEEIDRGTAVLPAKFLARKATSVTPSAARAWPTSPSASS